MNTQIRLDDAMARVGTMAASDVRAVVPEATGFGSFDGLPAQVEFSTEGRFGKLLRAIRYTSGAGEDWPVPVNAWLDGASIPRAFWSIVGSPYTGKYLSASIVHDHYCIVRSKKWDDTHRMFHEAMRCGGVGSFQARIMFYAVYRFGPRWQAGGIAPEAPTIQPGDSDAISILRDAETIRSADLGIEAIEALVDGERSRN